jgi:hypothetical protein
LLAEIVVDVQGPPDASPEEFFGWQEENEYYNEVRFDDDGQGSWYDDMDDSEDEDEDEDDEGETDHSDGLDFSDDLLGELDSDDEGVTWY